MKFYLIPAYEETIHNQGYSKIISAAETLGYKVEVLNIQIQNSSFKDLIANGVKKVSSTIEPDSAIMGFSTGALIAYKISTKIEFKKAFFCSISPLLEDDIPNSDALYKKYFGKETVQSLKNTKYGKSKAEESFFFVGDSEGRKLPNRTKYLAHKSNGKLTVVEKNDHELDKNYVRQIVSNL